MSTNFLCRVGDHGVGICKLHDEDEEVTITFTDGDGSGSGAGRPTADGIEVMVVGGKGIASCGHETIATTGCGQGRDKNGKAFHRIGDQGIIGGDPASIYYATSGSSFVSCSD